MNPLAFQTPIPRVVLTDLRSDVSDATTYTFTACQVDIWPTLSFADTLGTNPYVISSSRSFVAVAIHGEDAAATFGVTSVTLGGVAGTEIHDRGGAGAGILVNTAFYVWATEALQGITTTDIAVTFSEAVTGCAIGVMSISNVAAFITTVAGLDTTGNGTLTLTAFAVADTTGVKGIHFCFSTINAAGEALAISLNANTIVPTDASQAILLYEGSNAEFGYAGAYAYVTQTAAGEVGGGSWTLSWDGTANADAIAPRVVRI